MFNIVKSDAFYPNSAENVAARKRFLTLAVADCEQLYQDMQCMLAMGLPVKVSRLDCVSEMIDREIKLLKGARNGVKPIGKG